MFEVGAHRKIRRGTWEIHVGVEPGRNLGGDNMVGETITQRWLAGKSERSIVAGKRGNARGAKGPRFRRAEIKTVGESLEQKSLHEDLPGPGIYP